MVTYISHIGVWVYVNIFVLHMFIHTYDRMDVPSHIHIHMYFIFIQIHTYIHMHNIQVFQTHQRYSTWYDSNQLTIRGTNKRNPIQLLKRSNHPRSYDQGFTYWILNRLDSTWLTRSWVCDSSSRYIRGYHTKFLSWVILSLLSLEGLILSCIQLNAS